MFNLMRIPSHAFLSLSFYFLSVGENCWLNLILKLHARRKKKMENCYFLLPRTHLHDNGMDKKMWGDIGHVNKALVECSSNSISRDVYSQ